MDLINRCPTCFEITLSDCLDKIIVDAGLEPDTMYFTRITDKHGNKYNEAFTTNEDTGLLEIDLAAYPAGLFTPHAGAFQLQIFETEQACEAMELTLCDAVYTCILMSFEHIQTSSDLTEQTIPCGCPEPA